VASQRMGELEHIVKISFFSYFYHNQIDMGVSMNNC
jgi:hypothetical protein